MTMMRTEFVPLDKILPKKTADFRHFFRGKNQKIESDPIG